MQSAAGSRWERPVHKQEVTETSIFSHRTALNHSLARLGTALALSTVIPAGSTLVRQAHKPPLKGCVLYEFLSLSGSGTSKVVGENGRARGLQTLVV